jgi:hypothetical protein
MGVPVYLLTVISETLEMVAAVVMEASEVTAATDHLV